MLRCGKKASLQYAHEMPTSPDCWGGRRRAHSPRRSMPGKWGPGMPRSSRVRAFFRVSWRGPPPETVCSIAVESSRRGKRYAFSRHSGVLAEVPEREVVVGAVTRPWEPNITFRAVPPDEFAAFREPDYVKIVWTLRADPIGAAESIYRTETRVTTTDAISRAKFRRYWAFFSPGIWMIRWLSLGSLKQEAERRARTGGPEP